MNIRNQLHIVSTGRQTDMELIKIMKDIHPFITALHIREKSKSANEHIRLIMKLAIAGVPLSKIIVNDRVDTAVCSRSKGVQLAYHSLDVSLVRPAFPGITIGCSIHSVEESMYAEQHGADFLLFGHIFQTASKKDVKPRGLELLEKVAANTSLPVIAIGGIQPANVSEVMTAGASGIAVMSGVLEADSPLKSVLAYKEQLEVMK